MEQKRNYMKPESIEIKMKCVAPLLNGSQGSGNQGGGGSTGNDAPGFIDIDEEGL